MNATRSAGVIDSSTTRKAMLTDSSRVTRSAGSAGGAARPPAGPLGAVRAAARGSIRPRSVSRRARAEPSRLRQMRLATVVSQAPGDSMASCCCAGHGVPAGVGLLDGVLGLGQGAQQPVGEIDQLTPLAHDRVQARIGPAACLARIGWSWCRGSLGRSLPSPVRRDSAPECEAGASPHIPAGCVVVLRETSTSSSATPRPAQEAP